MFGQRFVKIAQFGLKQVPFIGAGFDLVEQNITAPSHFYGHFNVI